MKYINMFNKKLKQKEFTIRQHLIDEIQEWVENYVCVDEEGAIMKRNLLSYLDSLKKG